MCAEDSPEDVGVEEMNFYLEAVAELKSISTNDAMYIAESVMKLCNKTPSTKIKKTEFIDWCVLSKKNLFLNLHTLFHL